MAIYYVSCALLFAYGLVTRAAFPAARQADKRIVYAVFGLWFLLLALRHPAMGLDLGYEAQRGYLVSFQALNEFPLEMVRDVAGIRPYETGYVLFNILVGKIWNNRQFLLAVCAALSVLPIGWALAKESCDGGLTAAVYMALPCSLLGFSALRQAVALGFLMLALCCVLRRKPVLFLLLVVLAAQFHKASYLFLVAYPVYHVPVNFRWRLVSLALLPLLYALRRPLYMFAVSHIYSMYNIPDNNGSVNLLILYVLLYLFCTVFQYCERGGAESGEEARRVNGLMNLFYGAVFCQVFAGIHNVAARMGYPFTLALPLLLPLVVSRIRDARTRQLIRSLLLLFFAGFALLAIWRMGWARAWDYRFFWQSPPQF